MLGLFVGCSGVCLWWWVLFEGVSKVGVGFELVLDVLSYVENVVFVVGE